MNYPLRFDPIYKEYIWGTEVWLISDREDGMSLVANGIYAGRTLNSLFGPFPLLLKVIDAKEHLSVQVHPNENSPIGEPKSEFWYLLDDGSVYAGLKGGELIHHTLQRGDALFIPGGLVHAICGGTRLFEVQQNSNTTYRLHDWNRGTRPLHLTEALTCLDPKAQPTKLSKKCTLLHSSPHFVVEKLSVLEHFNIPPIPNTFQCVYFLEGSGSLTVDNSEELSYQIKPFSSPPRALP